MPRRTTIFDDKMYLESGVEIEADHQIMLAVCGPSGGKVTEVYLTDENREALETAVEPFVKAGRAIGGFKLPAMPKEIRVDHLLPKRADDPPDDPPDPGSGKKEGDSKDDDDQYMIPMTLPDGRDIPERFWESSAADSYPVKKNKQKIRKEMLDWLEVEATAKGKPHTRRQGRIAEADAHRWAVANPHLVPKVPG